MEIDEDSDIEIQDNRKGKMTRNEALQKAQRVRERKFKCRNCETTGHFTKNCPTYLLKRGKECQKLEKGIRKENKKSFL